MSKISVASVQAEIDFDQPELFVDEVDSYVRLSGNFIVTDGSGKADARGPLTRFKVLIFLPFDYPYSEPIVHETGNRIPRIMDRHINSENKCCCITIFETWLLTAQNKSVRTYLSGPVNNYFFSQYHYEQTKEWPLGEWRHGLDGVLDAYAELLGIEPNETLVRKYLQTLKLKCLKGHIICPCGSGARLRNCHREKLEALHQRIPPKMATFMLNRVEKSQ